MVLKKRSVFSQIILLVIAALVCVVLTVTIAWLAGSVDTTIFDFRDLNIANMVPVIIIGGFISCAVVGLLVLVVAKNVFLKLKDYFSDTNDGGNKK